MNKSEKIIFTPTQMVSNNYNNYINDNYIEYSGGYFAWLKTDLFGSKLITVDKDNRYRYFNDVSSPFRIYDNYILFVKGGELKLKDIDSKTTTTVVGGDVQKFAILDDSIIYSTDSFDDDSGEQNNELRRCKINGEKNELLMENVEEFYISDGKIFALDKNNRLFKLEQENFDKTQIARLNLSQYPCCVMPQGDNLICRESNEIVFYNIKTHKRKTVSIVDDDYANNKISFVCDDNTVFVSFQATKTDGSVVKNADDEHNGLWKIDSTSLSKTKVSSNVYENMFLQDKQLFAICDKSLYKKIFKRTKLLKYHSIIKKQTVDKIRSAVCFFIING